MRRAPKVTEVLPILYLRGLSTGDFRAALPVLLGEKAAGLSPTTITRLTAGWEAEYAAWRRRSLAETDYVYVWVDGVHFRVRLEEDRLCTLVMIGVRPDGTKELVGLLAALDAGATVVRVSHPATGSRFTTISVFPGTPPLPTREVSGTIFDGSDPARPRLNGATIEVLSGLIAGSAAVSGVAPQPVPGFLDWVGLTFPAGEYRIRSVPSGTYRVRVSKPGYAPQELGTRFDAFSNDFVLLRE